MYTGLGIGACNALLRCKSAAGGVLAGGRSVFQGKLALSTSAKLLSAAAANSHDSANSKAAPKLWGGRFTGKTDPLMEAFNNSMSFDKRMWRADLQGSMAYARALAKCKILSDGEAEQLVQGLKRVFAEWESGTFAIQPSDEDIHTANERRLTELIGPVAGKLHTGRSRNDQVATDVRLWLRDELNVLSKHLAALLRVAATRAKAEVDILMPGYTHLQPAQPVRWSHWLLSHAWAWQRDYDKLQFIINNSLNFLPLGSGAIAGHAFNIDRQALAKDLGFAGVTRNSMDAVSDRDFIYDTLAWASLLSVHLSRWAEDLIIYSSAEFGFVALSDAYSTGSSLMPQKKNPDALELLRGKSGRVVGSLITLTTVLKGLPSTYNKDLQEDKEPLFDAVDTLHGTIPIALGVLSTLTPRGDVMRSRLHPEMLATDLADFLVRKGVPFRETHHVAGAAVRLAETSGRRLTELTIADLKPLHPAFEDKDREAIQKVWSFENSVESRNAEGGTSRSSVLQQVEKLEAWLDTCAKH